MGRTSVKEREEIEESQDWHQPNVYLPPCPRFLLGCERRGCERVGRVGLALQAMLDVRRLFVGILLRSHWKRSRRGIEGGGGGRGRGILGGKPNHGRHYIVAFPVPCKSTITRHGRSRTAAPNSPRKIELRSAKAHVCGRAGVWPLPTRNEISTFPVTGQTRRSGRSCDQA